MAGEAFTRFPPMVPVARVAGDPIIAAASASADQRVRMSGARSIHA